MFMSSLVTNSGARFQDSRSNISAIILVHDKNFVHHKNLPLMLIVFSIGIA